MLKCCLLWHLFGVRLRYDFKVPSPTYTVNNLYMYTNYIFNNCLFLTWRGLKKGSYDRNTGTHLSLNLVYMYLTSTPNIGHDINTNTKYKSCPSAYILYKSELFTVTKNLFYLIQIYHSVWVNIITVTISANLYPYSPKCEAINTPTL